jgi:hypothetical protein
MRRSVVVLATALLLTGGGTGRAAAADGEFRYAAKVACSLLGTFEDDLLVRGLYRTAINVHNPTGQDVRFGYKVALAQPVNPPPGTTEDLIPGSDVVAAVLGPEEAVVIGCLDLAALFCPPEGPICVDFAVIEGFVVIRSPVELDVVVAYSARTAEGEVQTLDVEAIAPR